MGRAPIRGDGAPGVLSKCAYTGHPRGSAAGAGSRRRLRCDSRCRARAGGAVGRRGRAVLSGASRVSVRLPLLPQQLTRSLSLTFFISGRGLKGMVCSHCCLIGKNQPGAARTDRPRNGGCGRRPSPGGCEGPSSGPPPRPSSFL